MPLPLPPSVKRAMMGPEAETPGEDAARKTAFGLSMAGGPVGAAAGVADASLNPESSKLDVALAAGLGFLPVIPASIRKVIPFGEAKQAKLAKEIGDQTEEINRLRNLSEEARVERVNRVNTLRQDTAELNIAMNQLGYTGLGQIEKASPSQLAAHLIQSGQADNVLDARRLAGELQERVGAYQVNRTSIMELDQTTAETLTKLADVEQSRTTLMESLTNASNRN